MPSVEKSRDKSSKYGKSDKPERPKRPGRSGSSKYDKDYDDDSGPDDYSKAVTKPSKSRDLTKFKNSLEDLSDKALKKLRDQNDFTEEERSLLRKERRRRDAARKAEEDEEETPEAPAAPMDFNANLSNQNNITINNTGNEDMAKVMNRMLDMLQEKEEKKSKSEKTSTETEEVTTKKKSKSKKVKFVAEAEESKHKKKTATDWDSEETLTKFTEGTKVDINTDKRAQKQLAKFEPGLAQRQTISRSTMEAWVLELDATYLYVGFWQILFMYPPPVVTRVMTYLNLWIGGIIDREHFMEKIQESATFERRVNLDGLIWFLTECDAMHAWYDFIVPWARTTMPEVVENVGNGCFFTDPWDMIDIWRLNNMIANHMDVISRAGQGFPGGSWGPPQPQFGPGPFNPYDM